MVPVGASGCEVKGKQYAPDTSAIFSLLVESYWGQSPQSGSRPVLQWLITCTWWQLHRRANKHETHNHKTFQDKSTMINSTRHLCSNQFTCHTKKETDDASAHGTSEAVSQKWLQNKPRHSSTFSFRQSENTPEETRCVWFLCVLLRKHMDVEKGLWEERTAERLRGEATLSLWAPLCDLLCITSDGLDERPVEATRCCLFVQLWRRNESKKCQALFIDTTPLSHTRRNPAVTCTCSQQRCTRPCDGHQADSKSHRLQDLILAESPSEIWTSGSSCPMLLSVTSRSH